MDDSIKEFPTTYTEILNETNKLDFDQTSDSLVGSLLATLAATKPHGKFLELGTGSGLSTAWILHGMNATSTLISVDNDEILISIARKHLDHDDRVEIILGDGEGIILQTEPDTIDFIFADTWPGKYNHLEETLALLKTGGIYLIDDMLAQDNWPDGHEKKVAELINYLKNKDDIILTKAEWASGIIICTKIT